MSANPGVERMQLGHSARKRAEAYVVHLGPLVEALKIVKVDLEIGRYIIDADS